MLLRCTFLALLEEVDRPVTFGLAIAGALAALVAVLGIVWLIRVREPRLEARAAEQGPRWMRGRYGAASSS